MGFCTSYGYKNGKVDMLISPLDGDKNFCGSQAGFEDYPKLYITDFGFSTPNAIFASGVCVKKCPTKGDTTIDCKPTKSVKKCDDPEIIKNLYKTKSVMDYCFPASKADLPPSFVDGWAAALKSFSQSSIGKNFNDMYLSSRAMYCSIAMGVVYSFIFIYLMSFFAETISWIIIALVQGGLWAACAGCWVTRSNSLIARGPIVQNPDPKAEMTAVEKQELYLLIATIIFGLAATCFCCCVICSFRSLKLAIDVIDASADFLAGTKRIVLVPILYFFLIIVSIMVWSGATACVISMSKITADDIIPQGKNLEFDDNTQYIFLFMLFGILWITAWLEYTCNFIVMVAASTYYFDSNAS